MIVGGCLDEVEQALDVVIVTASQAEFAFTYDGLTDETVMLGFTASALILRISPYSHQNIPDVRHRAEFVLYAGASTNNPGGSGSH